MMPRRPLFTFSILFTLSLFMIMEIFPISFYDNKEMDQKTIRAKGTIFEKQKKDTKDKTHKNQKKITQKCEIYIIDQ